MFRQLRLPRRTFLRGTGAMVALPLLDAMTPALASAETLNKQRQHLKRMSFVYMPMGSDQSRWRPADAKRLDRLSPTLEPLRPVMDRVSIISDLELKNAYPGTHATSNSAFLSAAKAKHTESADYFLAKTVDQIAADAIGRTTPLRSLELAMDRMETVGQCDNGYACVYQNCLSWSSPTTPLPSEAHPRIVFERLFGRGEDVQARRENLQRRASLLDGVTQEIKQLKNRVGPEDRHRIDQYLSALREVEQRIQRSESAVTNQEHLDLDRPQGVPVEYGEHARLMFDLQVLAMQGDVTRVCTFQLARETSNRAYPEIGVPEPHHALTHHGNDPEKVAKVAKINRFHVTLFSEFLQKLAETPEAEGSLLDHSLVMYGSGMGNPNVHDHSDLPIIVAGGASESMPGGRHISFDQPQPLANLHLTLLHRLGVDQESFADSHGEVDDLFQPWDLS